VGMATVGTLVGIARVAVGGDRAWTNATSGKDRLATGGWRVRANLSAGVMGDGDASR